MIGKWSLLALVAITVSAHADSQRREPSLFLEYERELKKTGDQQKTDDNPFTQIAPKIAPTQSAPKPAQSIAVAKSAPSPEPHKKEIDNDLPAHDAFLTVTKPAPVTSDSLCPDSKVLADTVKTTPKGVIRNLKNVKEMLLTHAKEFLGTPYGFGNKTDDRTDCSGFTQQVYRQFGIALPHSAAEQALLGEDVDPSDLQVGDLLFYRTYKSEPSHVAIYAGDGQIIHASYTAHKVKYDSIDKGYYKERFLYAKRLALNTPSADKE